MIAHLRKIRISPKKANLVAGLIREKSVTEALAILKYTPKKAAKMLYKVVHSARSNAENNFKQDPDTLMIKEVVVTQGPTNKRFQPVSRGRAHPILKRTSHITVKVESDPRLATKATKTTKATKVAKEVEKETTTEPKEVKTEKKDAPTKETTEETNS
jgi:large subunit ribosomal protein L22